VGINPVALYQAVLSDVSEYLPFGPVGLGDIPPDASYKQFASSYLVSNYLKKLEVQNTVDADRKAAEKFLAANKNCKDWCLQFEFESDRLLFCQMVKELDEFFHPEGNQLVNSYYDLLKVARTGPGSALGANGFSLYAKLFSSRLTTTSLGLYSMYRDFIEWFPDFDEADANCRRDLGSPRIVDRSRCSFAPKTIDCSRLICVEPSLNMMYQLGFGTLLTERLRDYYRIDLSTQPDTNRRLAQLGSQDGSYATIDLSSASDSISVRLCEAIFPEWLLELLHELRSPSTEILGETVPLNMISTMGNGFTFPLQTIIFASLIRAAYRIHDIPIMSSKGRENWACFGDDLIVRREAYNSVVRLLKIAGFTLNSAKTFNQGPFRESCGSDWFYGQPVRPVYLRRLHSLQDTLVAINQLNMWSSYTGIPLRNAVQLLWNSIRPSVRKNLFVPFSENMDSGIRVPRALLPRDAYIYDSNKSMLYRPFRPRPYGIRVTDGGVHPPRGVKKLVYNPPGLYISFLFGELRDNFISVRHDRVKYAQKLQCIPFWDYIPQTYLINGPTVSATSPVKLESR